MSERSSLPFSGIASAKITQVANESLNDLVIKALERKCYRKVAAHHEDCRTTKEKIRKKQELAKLHE